RPLERATVGLRVEPIQLEFLGLDLRIPVDAYDHLLPRLHLLRVREGGLLDLLLDESLLDRGDRAAELVHVLDQLARPLLQFVRELLDEEPPSERIGGVGPARLVRENLLRPERDPYRALARQSERLVERVRVDRLRAAADRGERQDGHAR